jgi:sugar lactone lactonase YvrE
MPQRGPQWFAAVAVFFAAAGHAWAAPQDLDAQTATPQPPLPTVSPDYRISVYANVPEPMKLSFAPDGSLYVGRQPGLRIHRVTPGGRSVTEFGPPMADPDAVLADPAGRIGGRRNSVLVGGGGILAAIFPNQMASVIFNTGFADVDDMKFDRRGRLVFSDDLPRVLSSAGGPPTVLFSTPTRPGSIAIDDRNRIFVALADGAIRIYNPDGSLADSAFATGLAGLDTYLAFADNPKRDWGPLRHGRGSDDNLYVLSGTTLLRYDEHGQATTIGTGFVAGPQSGTGFVFGPDKALYVSDYYANRILRIARRDRRPTLP